MDEQIVTGKDGEQGVKNDKRFVSLKVKWSVGMGLGVLIIFAIFAVLLFQSFSSILLRQEKLILTMLCLLLPNGWKTRILN